MKRRKKNNSGRLLLLTFFAVMLMGGVVAGAVYWGADKNPSIEPSQNESFQITDKNTDGSAQAPEEIKVSLYAVGDNLYHQSVIDDGNSVEDYLKYYTHVAEDIGSADLAFVNQETTIGGAELGIGGYPIFNTPDAVGQALVNLGFDVVNQASNHTMDKGVKGIEGTIKFWEQFPDVLMTGMYPSQEARDEVKIIERNGIRFAFLTYTYGLNGYTLPADKGYLTNLIDTDLIRSDIQKAKKQSDAVIVSMHWGNEYSMEVTATQRNLSQMMADEGVALVLGHHPHVLAPVEWVEGKNGNQMGVYYSLGNFVHSMEVTNCMLGAAAKVEFTKNSDGEVFVSQMEAEPLINHYEVGKKGFQVYPLSKYPTELAARHGIGKFDRAMSIPDMESISKKILGDFYGQAQPSPLLTTKEPPSPSSPTGNTEEWMLALLNKENSVEGEYPVEITLISGNYGIPARGNMSVDSRIVDPLVTMFNAAKADGIDLYLRSAHRTYALQKLYYDNTYGEWIKAGKTPEQAKTLTLEYLAYPGTSEHHTGLAVDVISVEWENTVQALIDDFDTTDAYRWLSEHAADYGFILRYPKGKEGVTGYGYEPWHYRYVGVDVAKEIKNKGITLEEYLAN